jgi:signal transduction histidine kinase
MAAPNISKSGTAKMRPRARLIGLIGDELISDEPVALVELVKNAYDADADKVIVKFQGENPNKPDKVVVTDDGSGMSLDTVLNSWFEPGTIAKRKEDKSPGKGRLYQGAKGIGRFASARLAEFLFLESKLPKEKEGVFVLLEWGKFDEDSYLDEISVEYEVRHIPDLKHGTRLTLERLRKEWTTDDYEELHTRLSRLISPFNEVKDFEVELEIPARPELSGLVAPPDLILQPKYHLKGSLDDDGSFTGTLFVNKKQIKTFKAQKVGGKDARPLCGKFGVEIRAWDRDKEGLEPLGKELGIGIAEMRRTLNGFCGVSIYRDGFRVYPYGQKGNDWLNLDSRSRQNPVQCLANNQIVGAIQLSRETNEELKDRANREGMVLNNEHSALEEWFKEVLKLLEVERYRLRPREDSADAAQPIFEAFDLGPTVKIVRQELGPSHPVTTLISETGKKVKEGVERVQEVFSRLLMSSGLGQMVDIVIHEIGAPLGKINRQLELLQKDIELIKDETVQGKVAKKLTQIKPWLEQIYNLRQRLEPQTPAKRGRATTFSVRDEVEDNFNLYESLLTKQGIKKKILAPNGDIKVTMSRSSLGQILANLIDNAVFWICREKGEGKGGEIEVRIEKVPGGFRLVFSDNGPGVAPEDRNRIFEPYFTTKPNGMGLGLHISRLIIEPYGKLLLSDEGDLSGACFEAVFERKVGL